MNGKQYILPSSHHSFFAQAQSAGYRFNGLFGTDSFESSSLNKGVEMVIEGALFASSNVSSEFKARYLRRFKNTDQLVHAALAYEFALLLKDISTKTIPKTADELLKSIALTTGRDSVCGKYFYRNSKETGKYFSFPIAVRELSSGTPKVIKTFAAP